MPEHSLKHYWIQKQDHGDWSAFLQRQGDPQVLEQQVDIMLWRGGNIGFEDLDFW